ncbi:MAG: Arylsulfatase [Planctomycetota bacterium]|jgi:arylsulfatase A-like enzyme
MLARQWKNSLGLLVACCVSALAVTDIFAAEQHRLERPNVIIIYADDLGYGDLGCYGHPSIRTPHLDRMAAEGMRFTEFYSASEVCTPSRTALMTGRYPIRSGMCNDQFRVLRNNSAGGLPAGETTIAEMLKQAGYATAIVGKWHLGHLTQHLPLNHGFDSYFGMPYSNDMRPAPDAPQGREKFFAERNEYWQTQLFRGSEVVEERPDQRQLTKRYTEEATAFIREKKDAPFFLYMAHNFPHVPLFASEQFRGRSAAGIYGDVVEELDWSVGQILQTLRDEGLAEKTMVVFSSDNGPWLVFDSHGGSAGMLRDGKGSTWEGGMRVPGLIWWPGKVLAGVVQHEMGLTMDLLPTIAAISGAKLPDVQLDGRDLSPLLFGEGKVERGAFMYYRGTSLFACRLGSWKAHFATRAGYGQAKLEEHQPPLLFELRVDPGEKWNVAGRHPEVLQQIEEAVAEHRRGVQAVKNQLEETVK